MKKINKKAIPAITLIVTIMILSFFKQYELTQSRLESEQIYMKHLEECQKLTVQNESLTRECQLLLQKEK